MEDTADLTETLRQIQQQKADFAAVKSLLGLESRSRTILLIYYLYEYSGPESILETQRWLDNHPDFATYQTPPRTELMSILAKDAFFAAVDLELHTVATELATLKRPAVSSQEVLVLFKRGKAGPLRILMSSGVEIQGINRSCAALGVVKAMQRLFDLEQDRRLRAYDLVEFAFKNGVGMASIMDFCVECRELNDSSGINALLARGKEEEAIALMGIYRKVNAKSLMVAINSGCLKYAVEFASRGRPLKANRVTLVGSLLKRISDRLGSEAGNLDVYLYIIRRYTSVLMVDDAVKFAASMEKILSPQVIERELWKVLNPIKLIVQLIELTGIFASRFDHMRLQFERIVTSLNRLGVTLLEEVNMDQQMKFILFDKDLDDRDVIGLILQYHLVDFLSNTMIEKIANEVWNGPYDLSHNPLAATSVVWKLVTSHTHSEVDYEYNIRHKALTRNVAAMRNNQYEFAVWKNAAGLKVYFIALEYVMLTAILFMCELVIRDAFYKMDDITAASEGRDFTDEEHDAYLAQCRRARDYAFWWDIMGVSILIGASRIFTIPLFQVLTGRSRRIFTMDWSLNLVVFFSMLFIYIPTSGVDQLGMEHIMMDGEALIHKVEELQDDAYTSILTAVTVFCLGVRITYMLRYTNFLGPLINILKSMVRKTVEFGIFYFIVLFVFALAATLLFNSEDPAFSRIDYIVLTLFESSIGVFDLNPPDNYKPEAKIFYVIFVFVVNILLLSFIVAILNEIYAMMSPKNNSNRHQELFMLRDQYKPHKVYQFMVSSYYIFDIVLCIVFLPIFPFLSVERRKSLNAALLKFEYALCGMVMFSVYLALELIIVPIAYVLTVISKIKLAVAQKREGLWRRMAPALFFFVCGPLLLFYYVLTDIYYCLLHGFTHKPIAKYDKEASDYITEETMKDVIDNLKDYTDEDSASCDMIIKSMELIFSRMETPSIFRHLLLPSLNKILWIAQFAVFSRFIRQLGGLSAKAGHVNVRLLHDILLQFLRSCQLRQYIKQGFPAVKSMMQVRVVSPAPPTSGAVGKTLTNRSIMPLANDSRTVDFDQRSYSISDDRKKMSIAALKLYDRALYDKGIEKYCAHDESGVDVPIQLKKIISRLNEIHSVLAPQAEAITVAAAATAGHVSSPKNGAKQIAAEMADPKKLDSSMKLRRIY